MDKPTWLEEAPLSSARERHAGAKPPHRPHEYSVLETIKLLHAEHTGTEPMLGVEYRARLAWLRWRITEAWEPTLQGKVLFVEELIRSLARQVIDVADHAEERWRQTNGG